jgi:glyoxylase-like metal-dependent hydrolase (beta-lactamase superfamily II)
MRLQPPSCEDGGVIIERASNAGDLSNCFLVADADGGAAVFVDAGGPVAPLLAAATRLNVTPSHVLFTHHHADHVGEVGKLTAKWPKLKVLIHPLERELVPAATGTIAAGERLEVGELDIRPLHTPGHTTGMLSYLITHGDDDVVFTGDTLFRGSVGGVRGPGHGSYQALKDSIMGTLMELVPATVVEPGHAAASTVGREWEQNPFIRVWRGLDREGAERCTVAGEPATLVLLAGDYDGGTKAWVRWPGGGDDIVPGSIVQRGN